MAITKLQKSDKVVMKTEWSPALVSWSADVSNRGLLCWKHSPSQEHQNVKSSESILYVHIIYMTCVYDMKLIFGTSFPGSVPLPR